MLLQFSWNLIALEPVVTSWRFSVFVGLLFFVSNLYLAAALILPNSESQADRDLTAWFNDHGRWAMPFIIIYVLLAYPFNWFLLSDSPLNNPASAIIVIIASLTLFAKSRAIHAAATTMMVIVSIGLFVQMITFDH